MSEDKIQKTSGGGLGGSTAGGLSGFGSKFQQAASLAKTPLVLPRLFNQLVIFLLDGSGSMCGHGQTGVSKGQELHKAMHAVLLRLQQSRNKNCFDVSCRVYSNTEREIISQRGATEVDLGSSFDPTQHIPAEGTLVSTSLANAIDEAKTYLSTKGGKLQTKALIILLSDGAFADIEEAEELATSVRSDPGITLIKQNRIYDYQQLVRLSIENNWVENNIELKQIMKPHMAVIVTDIHKSIIWVSGYFKTMTGYSIDEVVNKNPKFLQGSKTNAITLNTIRQKINQQKKFKGVLINYKKSGEPYECNVEISPIFDTQGNHVHYIAFETDRITPNA